MSGESERDSGVSEKKVCVRGGVGVQGTAAKLLLVVGREPMGSAVPGSGSFSLSL